MFALLIYCNMLGRPNGTVSKFTEYYLMDACKFVEFTSFLRGYILSHEQKYRNMPIYTELARVTDAVQLVILKGER